jgi:hypothetical protein
VKKRQKLGEFVWAPNHVEGVKMVRHEMQSQQLDTVAAQSNRHLTIDRLLEPGAVGIKEKFPAADSLSHLVIETGVKVPVSAHTSQLHDETSLCGWQSAHCQTKQADDIQLHFFQTLLTELRQT